MPLLSRISFVGSGLSTPHTECTPIFNREVNGYQTLTEPRFEAHTLQVTLPASQGPSGSIQTAVAISLLSVAKLSQQSRVLLPLERHSKALARGAFLEEAALKPTHGVLLHHHPDQASHPKTSAQPERCLLMP